ncbi:DUF934 domain-containing protein [Ahrensia sp. R2A130]|uniref:DUF934 domain-containing protein n=1 Tax=Ahrensia sp. R2A130 TaxID=744979 RepID=UPI0001E0D7FA|nr:DUF934 domain-containing protein [Ahrensia sp. R2A130]EFL90314.1 conserved hypothetical protein [Ahrensia sp. R2A130]
MSTLFDQSGERADDWLRVEGDQPVPATGNVIVSMDRIAEALDAGRNGQIGVHLDPLDEVTEIADHLDRIALISLDFPSFANGTSYSKARWLRERHGFTGTLRATGDIRIDQVMFFYRCGFDELLIDHEPTIEALKAGKSPAISELYQPALGAEVKAGSRPWQRRWAATGKGA